MEQIARHVGVSVPTVRHILGNQAHLHRPETCEKVQQAARELGYRPNASARAMRTGRFGCVALLLSEYPGRGTLFSRLLYGIQSALSEYDLHLVLATVPEEQLTSEGLTPKFLRQWMVDGVLINYSEHTPQRLIQSIDEAQIPSVWINIQREFDCAHPDDFTAGRQAAAHLLALGHRRIAYLTNITSHYSVEARAAGYAEAMCEAGLAPVFFRETENRPARWAEICARHLTYPERPTAIVAYSHWAQPLIIAALRLGLRVPEDLSVVTFLDTVQEDVGLAVTTCMIPDFAMGRAAVEMLLQKIVQPSIALPSRALPFTLTNGETTAPFDEGKN